MVKITGIFSIGISDIIGNIATSFFWIYLLTLIHPEEYGEIIFWISIAGTASPIIMISTMNVLSVFSAKKYDIVGNLNFLILTGLGIASIILFVIYNRMDIICLLFGYTISSIIIGKLLGIQNHQLYLKLVLLQKVLTLALGLLFFYFGEIENIVFAISLSYIPFIFVINKIDINYKLNITIIKQKLFFIIQNYLISLFGRLSGQIDKIIIGQILGNEILGLYMFGVQINLISQIISQIIFKYTLANDSIGINNKFLKKISILTSLIIAVLGFFLVPILIPIFFPKYIESILSVQIIIFSIIPAALIHIYTSTLLANENAKFLIISNGLGLFALLTGIFILGELYGLIGISLAYFISNAIQALTLIVLVNKKSNFNL